MRYLLQRPLQDEIWSSMLIRSARRVGVGFSTAMRRLGVRGRTPTFFAMRHIREVAHWLSITELHALAEHTVLPYVVAFHGQEQRTRLIEAALNSSTFEPLKVAVAKGLVNYVRFRRYCAVCARHELRTIDTSFWHLSHNLPGVLVCTVHQLSLVETALTTHGRSRSLFELPHEALGYRLLPGRPTFFDLELARRSIALLGGKSLFGPARRPLSCEQDLLAKGFNYDLTLSPRKLANWLRHQMGGQPERYGIPSKDVDLKWAVRLTRPGDIHGLTFKRLALETAIDLYPTR